MRGIWMILVAFLLCSACSHRSDRKVYAYLQEVEPLTAVSPDSAYRRLKVLTTKDLSSLDDYCYYYLLCMEAKMNGSFRFVGSLETMKQVAKHYQKQGDSLMQLRASLALGFAFLKEDRLEAVKHFAEASRYALALGNKRLLAMAYAEYSMASLFFRHESDNQILQDEGNRLYPEAIRLAKEINDTLLLMNILWDGSHWYAYIGERWKMEEMLLEAFRLAELTNNRDYQSRLAIELAGYYGVHGLGMLDKAFHFSMYSLKVREGEVSERIYHFFMSSAFDNVGRKDSADYHRQIAESLPKEDFDEDLSTFTPVSWLFVKEDEGTSSGYIWLFSGGLLLILVGGGIYGGIRHSRKVSVMQQELDILSSQTPAVYEKIGQIVRDHLFKDGSDLQMTEADWRMLQVETDKQWNGIICRLQKEFCLTDMEIRLFCLNLMELPTSHMPFLFDRSRSTIYNKNRDLLAKLGIERTSATFKEDLKQFLEKEK